MANNLLDKKILDRIRDSACFEQFDHTKKTGKTNVEKVGSTGAHFGPPKIVETDFFSQKSHFSSHCKIGKILKAVSDRQQR